MKYAFYPGCVSRGGCPELYPSAVKVSAKLDIQLEELKDVGCTGAGVLPQYISDPINARTFAKAESLGLPLMTICSTCTGVMSLANYRLKGDPEYRAKINQEYLSEEGLEYKGTTEVKHLLWVLFEDYGIERLKSLLRKPLKGLRVSPFYGCYIRRPPEAITPTKELNRRKNYLDELIEILGAELADISGKGKCCGFPILTANEENSLAMVGKHTGEAREKGADFMVTPCPLCHLNLDGNQTRAEAQEGKEIGLPILHLPQFLGLALGFDPGEMNLKRHIVSTQTVESKVSMLT
ncbi:MAG TPA: CoB--CoM heterodisulfide reductase iron-sulfur subunit B family protein [Candidatus Udaeobacter sp.]|jgi:succinate dehydrogenase / fumarate reductase cytochrome b subunit|nr:CoB--CoM heterodisulfide reductase iron-sulfur subunit B family protein [Candidatus Udaeobacter sp.]